MAAWDDLSAVILPSKTALRTMAGGADSNRSQDTTGPFQGPVVSRFR
jgi:hypothetical protein